MFRAAYDHLEATPPLLRPVTATVDAIEDARGDKRAVLWTALDTHGSQVLLSTATAIYGLVGLIVGSFIAEVLISVAGALVRGRSRRQFAR